jgi:TIGR03009 family protein
MRRRRAIKAAQCLAVWAMGVSMAWGQQARPSGEAAGAGNAAAQGQPRAAAPQQAPRVDPRKMDWLLGKWEEQSSLLNTLDVAILRIDDTPDWGDVEYYAGRALFKSPNRAFIDFNKIKLDAKNKPMKDPKDPKKWLATPYERIICTGQEVWQYRSDTQQIFVFPLDKDEQKKAVEEGPLPFLFNMKADQARARYQMTLMSEDDKGYGVSIKPKLQEDKDSFSLAYVMLDRRYLLPLRIVLVSPDGKSKKDFRLGPMTPNKAVNEKNFEGRPLGPPWKVIHNPAGEERPRAGVARQRREPPAGPAAARPQAPGAERR